MKQHAKVKKTMSPAKIVQGFADQLLKVQQQLTFMDKKIDTLINQPPRPFQRPEQHHHQGDRRPDNNYRERVLHKAVCADCKKECEVPFRPTGNRPVYCKDCFAKRKNVSVFRKEPPAPAPVEKKRPVVARKRPRAKK